MIRSVQNGLEPTEIVVRINLIHFFHRFWNLQTHLPGLLERLSSRTRQRTYPRSYPERIFKILKKSDRIFKIPFKNPVKWWKNPEKSDKIIKILFKILKEFLKSWKMMKESWKSWKIWSNLENSISNSELAIDLIIIYELMTVSFIWIWFEWMILDFEQWFRPMYVDRMTLLVICFLGNLGLAVYGLIEQPHDFASFVLAIFIMNLLLYTMFYIIMKLRHGEKVLLQPVVYIVLSTVGWAAAMYFFINKAITWKVTPPHSLHSFQSFKLHLFQEGNSHYNNGILTIRARTRLCH